MALLLAIVTHYLTGIARGSLLFAFNGIVSCHQDGVLFFLELFPPFIFVIGLGGLIGAERSGEFSFN